MNGETSNLGEAVVFGMLGGPGSGKGTQSQLLSQAFNIVHISIGNVLREEMDRQGSPYGDIIRQNMMSGKVGPTEITIPILKGHISKNIAKGARGFILDGFPRNMEQCDAFERQICPIAFLVVLDCPDSVMIDRLVQFDRGRSDDSLENIKRRIETFQETTFEVISRFQRRGKAYTVNSDDRVDRVQLQLESILAGVFVAPPDPGFEQKN